MSLSLFLSQSNKAHFLCFFIWSVFYYTSEIANDNHSWETFYDCTYWVFVPVSYKKAISESLAQIRFFSEAIWSSSLCVKFWNNTVDQEHST